MGRGGKGWEGVGKGWERGGKEGTRRNEKGRDVRRSRTCDVIRGFALLVAQALELMSPVEEESADRVVASLCSAESTQRMQGERRP